MYRELEKWGVDILLILLVAIVLIIPFWAYTFYLNQGIQKFQNNRSLSYESAVCIDADSCKLSTDEKTIKTSD